MLVQITNDVFMYASDIPISGILKGSLHSNYVMVPILRFRSVYFLVSFNLVYFTILGLFHLRSCGGNGNFCHPPRSIFFVPILSHILFTLPCFIFAMYPISTFFLFPFHSSGSQMEKPLSEASLYLFAPILSNDFIQNKK